MSTEQQPQQSQSRSVFQEVHTSYDVYNTSLATGFVFDKYEPTTGFMKFSPVFADKRGTTNPQKGERVYNDAEKKYASIHPQKAMELVANFDKVYDEDVVIGLSEEKTLTFSLARNFEWDFEIAEADAVIVIYNDRSNGGDLNLIHVFHNTYDIAQFVQWAKSVAEVRGSIENAIGMMITGLNNGGSAPAGRPAPVTAAPPRRVAAGGAPAPRTASAPATENRSANDSAVDDILGGASDSGTGF